MAKYIKRTFRSDTSKTVLGFLGDSITGGWATDPHKWVATCYQIRDYYKSKGFDIDVIERAINGGVMYNSAPTGYDKLSWNPEIGNRSGIIATHNINKLIELGCTDIVWCMTSNDNLYGYKEGQTKGYEMIRLMNHVRDYCNANNVVAHFFTQNPRYNHVVYEERNTDARNITAEMLTQVDNNNWNLFNYNVFMGDGTSANFGNPLYFRDEVHRFEAGYDRTVTELISYFDGYYGLKDTDTSPTYEVPTVSNVSIYTDGLGTFKRVPYAQDGSPEKGPMYIEEDELDGTFGKVLDLGNTDWTLRYKVSYQSNGSALGHCIRLKNSTNSSEVRLFLTSSEELGSNLRSINNDSLFHSHDLSYNIEDVIEFEMSKTGNDVTITDLTNDITETHSVDFTDGLVIDSVSIGYGSSTFRMTGHIYYFYMNVDGHEETFDFMNRMDGTVGVSSVIGTSGTTLTVIDDSPSNMLFPYEDSSVWSLSADIS